MDVLALVICAVIALGAAWFVAQPLLAGAASPAETEPTGSADAESRLLTVEKEILYQSLHELDLDFAAGKLSEPDYRTLRAKQEAQAIEILKALDTAAATGPPAPADSSDSFR